MVRNFHRNDMKHVSTNYSNNSNSFLRSWEPPKYLIECLEFAQKYANYAGNHFLSACASLTVNVLDNGNFHTFYSPFYLTVEKVNQSKCPLLSMGAQALSCA